MGAQTWRTCPATPSSSLYPPARWERQWREGPPLRKVCVFDFWGEVRKNNPKSHSRFPIFKKSTIFGGPKHHFLTKNPLFIEKDPIFIKKDPVLSKKTPFLIKNQGCSPIFGQNGHFC